jgi:hypothetical protein
MYRNLWWILHFAAEFDACVNKFSCFKIIDIKNQIDSYMYVNVGIIKNRRLCLLVSKLHYLLNPVSH